MIVENIEKCSYKPRSGGIILSCLRHFDLIIFQLLIRISKI